MTTNRKEIIHVCTDFMFPFKSFLESGSYGSWKMKFSTNWTGSNSRKWLKCFTDLLCCIFQHWNKPLADHWLGYRWGYVLSSLFGKNQTPNWISWGISSMYAAYNHTCSLFIDRLRKQKVYQRASMKHVRSSSISHTITIYLWNLSPFSTMLT